MHEDAAPEPNGEDAGPAADAERTARQRHHAMTVGGLRLAADPGQVRHFRDVREDQCDDDAYM